MLENWDDYRIFTALIEASLLLQSGKYLGVQHSTILLQVNTLLTNRLVAPAPIAAEGALVDELQWLAHGVNGIEHR